MGDIFFYIILFGVTLATFVQPWIGVVSYYLLSILGPQYIWWWVFGDIRASFIIGMTTIISIFIHFFSSNTYDLGFIWNKKNVIIGIMWIHLILSYFLGPYADGFSYSFSGLSPEQLFSITNTIFVIYFFSSLEINSLFKLKYLFLMFSACVIYLIYWANLQYFTQNWYQFNWGRLMGPISLTGGSIYKDENTFAMLFVTGLPFVYYLSLEFKSRAFRYILWSVIPFGFHAVFLTGSRGGLLGLCVSLVCIVLLSSRRALLVPLILLFMVFFQWQGGAVMLQRSTQIVNIEGERSAGDRLTAWQGGIRMIVDNPVSGVGLGSFVTALPDYIESRHMVAHNTFIQFSAESGIGCGLAYVLIIALFVKHSLFVRDMCKSETFCSSLKNKILNYNNAVFVSFVGLITCSLFLSLNTYEVFYFLVLMNNSLFVLIKRKNLILSSS